MKYFVVDVEATDSAINDRSEIIQMGITVVDNQAISYCSSVYIKPYVSRLNAFITELTGITEKHLMEADYFNSVAARIFTKFPPNEHIFVSWGNFDIRILNDMFNLWKMPEPIFRNRVNLKVDYANWRQTKQRGLAKAIRAENLNFEGRHHNAKYDALNTAKILMIMEQEGWKPQPKGRR